CFLFTLPGLFLGSTGAIRRPGFPSQLGPPAILVCAVIWLVGGSQPTTVVLPNWLPFLSDGSFALRVDGLSAFMLAVLGLIATCVYIYSLGYLEDDPGIRRFFAFLDVFVGAMALLVVAGNLAVLLIGWTGVGMTSYFLISFWREKPGSLYAGLQAIAANAVGDGALILAAVLLPAGCGDLLGLSSSTCTSGVGGAALVGALLVIAASAKSAQGPLYFWLPSAMAGPTPISALIHAATMVAAGVYLLARTHVLLALTPVLMTSIAALGVATALFGAVWALRQSNLKRGLAYSTVSQLGYMVAGIGFGVPFAAVFHLGSQALFKAALFLAAGVIIHAIGGDEELSAMGGLARALPAATLTFLAASISLFGLPLTAGAFSKDTILDGAFASSDSFIQVLGWLLVFGVLLSGLYIGRLFFATFYGPRHVLPVAAPADREPASAHDGSPRHLHHISPTLTLPLVPLAVGSILFGYVQWPLGGLAHVLSPALGNVALQSFATPTGLIAAALGLVGFVAAGALQARRSAAIRPLGEGYGWVDTASAASLGLARAFAGIQNGRAGRYAVATVLGFAAILIAAIETVR
ncbi:MAG TPA: proton-conducting transporter membrane subunit, partial [Chloroflexota bacterium]|nr:proton-conducting transporter membrane subunit [Chloroflexota bacterium]